jgi:predicted nuclease of predicted toxin-antitoxin system
LGKAPDETVLSNAVARGSVLLTHDLDFGKLMAFSGKSAPSIVIFRLQRLNAAILADLFLKSWPLVEKPLLEGAIVVIERDDVRIRRLPIGEINLPSGPTVQERPAVYRSSPEGTRKGGGYKLKRGKKK